MVDAENISIVGAIADIQGAVIAGSHDAQTFSAGWRINLQFGRGRDRPDADVAAAVLPGIAVKVGVAVRRPLL